MPERIFRGDRLREAREQRRLSQSEMDLEIGAGINYIGRVERGEVDPTSRHVAAIARVLGVSSDYLLGLTDDPLHQVMVPELSADEQAFIQALRTGDLDGVLAAIQRTRLSTPQQKLDKLPG